MVTKKKPADVVVSFDATGDVESVEKDVPKPEPKKSEPKPGDVDYDWSGHYDTTDLYTHTFPGGTVVAIKPFAAIYSKTWLYKIRQLQTDVDIEFAAIDRAACETAKEVLLNLDDSDGDPIEEFYTAWVKAGTAQANGDNGLTAGE